MASASDVRQWKNEAITQEVLQAAQAELDASIAAIASGAVLGDTAEQTATQVAKLVGRIEGLTFLIEYEGDNE
jgi:hypothetical protein